MTLTQGTAAGPSLLSLANPFRFKIGSGTLDRAATSSADCRFAWLPDVEETSLSGKAYSFSSELPYLHSESSLAPGSPRPKTPRNDV